MIWRWLRHRAGPAALALLLGFSSCKSRGAPLRDLSRTPPAPRYERLRGPYSAQPGPGRTRAATSTTLALPAFPPPVSDVLGVDYYTDARHSEIDPALKARNAAVEAPLRELGRSLMLLSDGYLRSGKSDPTLAARTLDGLFSWASADALLGRVNRAGLNQVKWALVAYSLDYLKVRDAPGLDQAKQARIERWFRQLSAEQMSYAKEHPDWPDHANNHGYWAGLAVASAGIAASDRELFDWGVARYRLFLSQVRGDGTLPLELARGKRALHYHLFAVAPLVMLAELAEVNDVHLYEAGDRALDRLVSRCVRALADPRAFGAEAGAEQVLPDSSELAWAEIYSARFPRPDLRPWLRARPLVSEFLGGDLTLAFARALPAEAP